MSPPQTRGPAKPATDAVDDSLRNTASHQIDINTPHALPQGIDIPDSGSVQRVSQLGPYRLIRELGSGGMGIVYEAEDTNLGRRVALKVLRPNLPTEQAARERFLREARAMGSICHDNVVNIFQVGEDAGFSYMAMQLLAGETLESLMEREPRFASYLAARIGREVAMGLAAAHENGLIHRDVKPSNIWLEAGTGRVKLLDFGLALAADNPHLTHSGFVIGTPSYMSPEQARGEPLDGRSDLFSLGTILYRLTTGERPFEGPSAMAIMRNLEMHSPMRVTAKRADVPAAFSNLIMQLLSKHPKDRPSNATEVADRLARPEITRPSHLPVAPQFQPSSSDPSISLPTPIPATISYSAPTPSTTPVMRAPTTLPKDARPPALPKYSTSPPPSHQHPFLRVLVLLALTSVGIASFWYLYIADVGLLTLESETPSAEIAIREKGELKFISRSERRFELSSGTYELELLNPKQGYRLSRTSVKINRRGEELVRVLRESPPPQ